MAVEKINSISEESLNKLTSIDETLSQLEFIEE